MAELPPTLKGNEMPEEKIVEKTERTVITGDAESGTDTQAEQKSDQADAAKDGAKDNPGSSSNDSGSNDSDKGQKNPEKPQDGGGPKHG